MIIIDLFNTKYRDILLLGYVIDILDPLYINPSLPKPLTNHRSCTVVTKTRILKNSKFEDFQSDISRKIDVGSPPNFASL